MRALLRRIRLALGRLDILCLEVFFERLVRGGVVVIDDYGYWKGSRKAVDQYFEEEQPKLMLHRTSCSGRIAVKSSL